MKNAAYLKQIKHGGFRSLVKRALESGINVELISRENKITRFQYGQDAFFIRGKNVPAYRRMGEMTKNKVVTKMILEDFDIRTPRGFEATSLNEAKRLIKKNKLSYPVIIKPSAGTRGLGVTWDIHTNSNIEKAITHFELASAQHDFLTSKSKTFLVEEMFQGHEYRVLGLDGKVISCVEKIPASITGDGHSSIKKLIHDFNQTRLPGFFIHVDKVARETLKKNKLTLKSILPEGHTLRLRNNLNMSDGGRSIDVTAQLHPVLKKICIKAIHSVGLTFGGVDLMADDISNPKTRYVILEINSNPYYNMNEKPLVEGKGIDISWLFLKKMFPSLKKSSRNA